MLPEIKAYITRARLRRGVELVKLANRIDALKMQEDDPENSDMPADATLAADQSRRFPRSQADNADSVSHSTASSSSNQPPSPGEKRHLSKDIKGAIFREVVLAKVREMKEQEQTLKVAEEAEKEAKRRSVDGHN